MNFTTDKETLLNKLKITEKTTLQRGIQPVLANILFETENNQINLTATDLDLTVKTSMPAVVKEEGKITLPAKKLVEIVSKLPDKPIDFSLDTERGIMTLKCGNSKFDVIGISADEFPDVNVDEDIVFTELESKVLVKAVKNTVYAAAGYENKNIISGVFCAIEDGRLEMAATDGNRLARCSESVIDDADTAFRAVIPSKTLNEILRVNSILNEEKIAVGTKGAKIVFKSKGFTIGSNVLTGEYPAYKQLIPPSCETTALVANTDFRTAIERVSCMANERTDTIKLSFFNNKLTMKSESPDAGASEEVVPVKYYGDEFLIAFNYRYIYDFLKITDAENIKIDLTGSLSATIFRPDTDEDMLCLIMPVSMS